MNLNLTIDVDEETFSSLCETTLKDLPKDKLQEIMLKAVEAALLNDKNYNNYNNKILITNRGEPTPLLRTILEKADFSAYFEPVAKKISDFIIENYQTIVFDAFTKIMADTICTRYELQAQINQAIDEKYRR